MKGLADLRMFSEIARSESMATAASRLGLSPATISGRLKALEEHYGVTLVRRTTRALALTAEGRMLLERSRPLLDGYEDLEQAMGVCKRGAQGKLVISSPLDFGRRHVSGLVAAFSQTRPDIEFELRFETGEPAHDVRFDIGFRIGPMRSSSLITRKLIDIDIVTCAAPAYLARHGRPATPADLKQHDCLLRLLQSGRDDLWDYRAGGQDQQVRVDGRHAASDLTTLVELALSGLGIVRAPRAEVGAMLAAGDLVAILEDHAPVPQPVHLVSERRRLLPSRTAAFIDYAVEHFRRPSLISATAGVASASGNRRNAAQQNDGVKFFSLQNPSKKISSLSRRTLLAVPD
jgi:DNA-binding transcriptional LysR family regulator